ncbi:hypothetical protein Lgra_2863 [Legionella gratiana]|uniref:Uncharacterized protein n=1 Tax=Legionella gratiana TaxID=45066 RepID=A0A378J4W9_9GAMM|nr:hypothetical protein [Legionella gratiana]KTD06086.1 hypothetical protein Lgra_2863 [Legionella gratiana]STX42814.1 Uncharacterised protein [Legionella gratiana]
MRTVKTLKNQKECAIISLTPKKKLLPQLKDISEDLLSLPEEKINKLLNDRLLKRHTVPVCIPLLKTPQDLYLFIKNNSEILFDFMLTTWPFPIKQWGFSANGIGLIDDYIDIQYFPTVCKSIAKPFKNTMELAVTLITPTPTFIDYIAESIASKKIIRSEEEITLIKFLVSTGIAVVTNKLEKSINQQTKEFIATLNDSKNYLSFLQDKILETLFGFYFKSKEEFPSDRSDEFLNVWFNTNTCLGLYLLTKPLSDELRVA